MSDLNSNALDPRLRDIAAASTYQSPLLQSASRPPLSPVPYDTSQLYLQQQTPITDHEGDGSQDGGPNDPKRPRACEACRGLKVKCEPDVNNPEGPCKRCAKANRNCIVTAPSRKRQKKTDSRVAELEKKIDALTATLAQKAGAHATATPEQDANPATAQSGVYPYQQVTNGGYSLPYSQTPEVRSDEWAVFPKPVELNGRKASIPPMVVAGQKRKHDGRDYSMRSGSPATTTVTGPGFLIDIGAKKPPAHAYADVIDRGLLTTDMASNMFQCYVDKMTVHIGAVTFPAGTTAAEVRKHQPDLFLAILSASSGSNYPKLQKQLTKEIMARYAERIIINGEKTLELVQALHVSTIWYYPPEHFEELKFYQLIHIAAAMAIDIGLGKKNRPKKRKSTHGLWRDHPWRRTPYPDPESMEARRTWLSCYFLCANSAMGLRRPNLLRWNSFMQECVEVLESSSAALRSDTILCHWVRSQHIAEEAGIQFSMDDPTAALSLSDPKVQYALKGFERDLQKWSEQLTPEYSTPSLTIMKHVIDLYIHEVALHVNHNVEEFKPPFTEEGLRGNQEDGDSRPLTAAHIDALSTCLSSIDGIINTFLQFDVDTVCCLPVANFVRLAYAVVVLIKMFFVAARPNSEHGHVISKDNMKVEQYLDGLVEKFKAAAAEERSRPAAKFLMVLLMLKTWFHRQRESKSQQSEQENANSTNPSTSSKDYNGRTDGKPGFTNQNTPLQLLSEVATGNSRGPSRSETSSNYPSSTNWQEQQVSYPSYGPTTQYSMNQAYGNANADGMGNASIDPSLGFELGYAMGDNLEQAMGMTLGAGDFGDYFTDDTFFGGLMDNAPAFEGF